ncbi:MAG: hypothetical protein MUF49_26025 [Oculatellaceae cyanobacterium Prado106]|jgi:hypothetical protein|nr:hypothetical protein [Oculatellaceae cyanobacterium Prado106]
MTQGAIHNLLTLPGIQGIALMDGRSRPSFYGFSANFGVQQREAFAQGIQQVIDTTPADFQHFEFRFQSHQVYIHKLDYNITLLLVSQIHEAPLLYANAVEFLRIICCGEEEAQEAIATFRQIANPTSATTTPTHPVAQPESALPQPQTAPMPLATPKSGFPPPPARYNAAAYNPPTTIPDPITAIQAPGAITLRETLMAMNHLSQLASQYLGTIVVINYWKTSRPAVDWLNNFVIERSAQFNVTGKAMSDFSQAITAEQHQVLQQWVGVFIQQCSKVIRDFPAIVSRMPLDDRQRTILLPEQK